MIGMSAHTTKIEDQRPKIEDQRSKTHIQKTIIMIDIMGNAI